MVPIMGSLDAERIAAAAADPNNGALCIYAICYHT